VEQGLVQVPEGRKIFPTMTVLENLELGSYTAKAKVQRKRSLEHVFDLFPI
ncbi:MAG: branched-chain amino acid ABC transporter ATP-binding protein, partial [Gammaproteobacteria bacterium]|nr:branched-chain amino acid ABC transporter ATP-binding protein [Gammaproteobacteria bacterium]NIT63239.1 branched-chain amino acid ABC transporter ATP-binding protein [Gammaproteobacteria bacterium]NIV20169.1 branched-chain amino acid ABC transporter ATP-binding protein [Gammaproteobacteria bacterium]NIY31819.1 branched-chain amino acid ABC transporter ATP-binding protein [Gammaproteobacteria bacterium]